MILQSLVESNSNGFQETGRPFVFRVLSYLVKGIKIFSVPITKRKFIKCSISFPTLLPCFIRVYENGCKGFTIVKQCERNNRTVDRQILEQIKKKTLQTLIQRISSYIKVFVVEYKIELGSRNQFQSFKCIHVIIKVQITGISLKRLTE